MKNALLTVSLLVNLALVGAMIYTTIEKNNLDLQRENLAISNEKYQKKLEKFSSTTSTETQETATSVSNSSDNNSPIESTIESAESSQEVTDNSEGVKLLNHIYYFDGFSGTIMARNEETSQMSEQFTRTPVTIINNSGTWQADLFTNNDGTAQIVQQGTTILNGTWKPTKEFEILSLKSFLSNSTRVEIVNFLTQRTWNDTGVSELAQTALENASAQNVSDEQWKQLSNDIIDQLETMERVN